ncbi:GNAT family N-acetyltransferase [Virgibacillus sp. DJP39]|uniref:GNAT family N-acetyltransferase n=1 Tax=Virgibacillus sp. DJP39 TaxID=3409790 RepID=UPI003BB561FF
MNNQQLNDIKELQLLCEKEDKIQLKLNWEMLKSRKEKDEMDFYHYEDGSLVGFLAIYQFGNKYEICGMVNPGNRNRGIFTSLFNQALKVIPHEAKEILLNTPANAEAARNWLQTKACDYSFSEYQMKWVPVQLEVKQPIVRLRKAGPSDLETQIKLDIECFEYDPAGARDFNENNGYSESKVSYMIEVESEVVGKIGIQRDENESYIYGFAIFPEFQGKGYGRNALIQTVLAEKKTEGVILLEVAAENKNALKLYEECGFYSYEVQDYYQFNRVRG